MLSPGNSKATTAGGSCPWAGEVKTQPGRTGSRQQVPAFSPALLMCITAAEPLPLKAVDKEVKSQLWRRGCGGVGQVCMAHPERSLPKPYKRK